MWSKLGKKRPRTSSNALPDESTPKRPRLGPIPTASTGSTSRDAPHHGTRYTPQFGGASTVQFAQQQWPPAQRSLPTTNHATRMSPDSEEIRAEMPSNAAAFNHAQPSRSTDVDSVAAMIDAFQVSLLYSFAQASSRNAHGSIETRCTRRHRSANKRRDFGTFATGQGAARSDRTATRRRSRGGPEIPAVRSSFWNSLFVVLTSFLVL